MIIYDYILFAIITFALFFQGFYFGRKQFGRVVIVSLVLLASDIMMRRVYTLPDVTSHIKTYDIVIPVIYVIFWWGLGYIAGHIILIRDNDIGKVKRIRLEKTKI